MKAFYCTCGWRVFFENTQCLGCGRRLGFDPRRGSVVALEPAEGDVYPSASIVRPRRYRLCRNYRDHQVCNWLVAADAPHDYCLAANALRAVRYRTTPYDEPATGTKLWRQTCPGLYFLHGFVAKALRQARKKRDR